MTAPMNMTMLLYPVLPPLPYPLSYSLASPAGGFLWLTLAETDAQDLQLLRLSSVSGPPQAVGTMPITYERVRAVLMELFK